MGFNFGNFIKKTVHSAKRFGSTVNRHFNVMKSHARRVLPTVRRVAEQIRDGAAAYSSLPMVGTAFSQVSQLASGVHLGARLGERFFDQADRFQQGMGIDNSLRI